MTSIPPGWSLTTVPPKAGNAAIPAPKIAVMVNALLFIPDHPSSALQIMK
jgi:hypothetical protein